MGGALAPGDLVELAIVAPVAGGRMLARHDGQVVLVAGAIPGERVRARIERQARGVVFATTTEVIEPSPARRDAVDPGCGGEVYAHISADQQPEYKRLVLRDALARGGRITWDQDLPVHAADASGYRIRARLHVRGDRVGFFREGSHEICRSALATQLTGEAVSAVDAFVAALPAPAREALDAIELSENRSGRERVLHLEWRDRTRVGADWLGPSLLVDGVTGVSMPGRNNLPMAVAGVATVSDPVTALLEAPERVDPAAVLRRHAASFFQGNRYLLPRLVSRVTDAAGAGSVVDLYSGVGLFAVALAALGRGPVTAIEGDAVSGADLSVNAAPFGRGLTVQRVPVEDFVRRLRLTGDNTIIVDPPRTGMSRTALDGVLAARASRLVYVSCDVATLARDLRRMLDAGYHVSTLEAFDLFPNTAHIETLAVLDRN